MATQVICDICKKDIGPLDNSRKFKIRERKHIPFTTSHTWIDIDAHADCVRALLDAAKDPKPIPPHGGSSQQDK